jgi:FkbM family methyltransferase
MLEISAPMKSLVMKLVPDTVLNKVKKRHYFSVLKGFREEEERDMAIVRYLVRPGDSVVDLGANIGIYTQLLSNLVGPDGEVVSIEAVPSTFEILSSNVKGLQLDNVKLLNFAVAEEDGTVWMEVPGYRGFYRARIATEGEGKGDSGNRVMVGSRTMDTLFGRHPGKITFIKCDVEGHELSCIRGAARTIEKHGSRWLMEIGDNPDAPGSKGKSLLEEFGRNGYGAFWFDGASLRRRNPGDKSVNYFILKPGHLDQLRQAGLPFPILA